MKTRGSRSSSAKKVSWTRRLPRLGAKRRRGNGRRISPVAILIFCAIAGTYPGLIAWAVLGVALYFGAIAASTVLGATSR